MTGINEVLQYLRLSATAAKAALLVAAVLANINTTWAAGTIVQQDDDAIVGNVGSGWLAFEVEDFDQLIDVDNDGVTWSVLADVDASGGTALEADQGASFDNNNPGGEADFVFNVMFTIPDQYRVFARYKNLGEQGDNDSFYTSGDVNSFPIGPTSTWFGSDPAAILRTIGSDPNQLDDPGSPGDPNDPNDPAIPPTPQYFYASVGLANVGIVNSIAEINEVLEFRVGIREQGAILDRIVFVDDTEGGPASQTSGRYGILGQLDALPNSPIEGGTTSDVDGDGDVDGADFLQIQRTDPSAIAAWQADYPSGTLSSVSSVPEPSSCLLLLAGSLMGAMRRRK